jgi:tetratricopeptide (TPR) repeat protein
MPESNDAASRFTLPRAIAALGIALAFLAYANTLASGFAFDDLKYIVPNESIRSLANFTSFLDMSEGGKGYRPLRNFVNALNYAACGLDPAGWHLVNVLLHVAATALVYRVARRLFGAGTLAAAVATILFAVHPIHTEAVANVSGRKDILATIFFLLGWLAFAAARETPRRRYFVAVFSCLVLGFLSKEMALSLPIVLFLHDVAFGKDDAAPKTGVRWAAARAISTLRRHALFYGTFGAGLALAALYLIVLKPPSAQTWWGGSPATNFLTVACIHVHYVKLLFLPTTLVGDYTFNVFPVTADALDPASLAALVAVLALVAGAVATLGKWRLPAFCVLFHFVTLLPVSHLKPHHELAGERFLYLPSIGFALLSASAIASFVRAMGARRVALAFVLPLVLLYTGRTFARNLDWKNDKTFWAKTIEDAPLCARAHRNLAFHLFKEGRQDEAFASMRRSMEIEPDSGASHFNLAIMLEQSGKPEQAIPHYETAEKHFRFKEMALLNLGILYGRLGRLDDAERHFRKLTEVDPGDGSVWFNLGVIATKRGAKTEADALFRKAAQAERPCRPPD